MSQLSQSATGGGGLLVSIECLRGSSTAGEWTGHLLQTGDIVEEIAIDSDSLKAPFKKGTAGVQKILRKAYKNNDTSVVVRVRRGRIGFAELHACIVPDNSSHSQSGMIKKKKRFVLRAIGDPNYAFGFSDRTETECRRLQASTKSRMIDEASSFVLEGGYFSYDWEKKMESMLSVPNSSCFLSILFLPKVSDRVASLYYDVEETLARTNAWLNASQNSGVPIVFINIQTESLLTKVSGETASSRVTSGSLSELDNVASSSMYGFEDYHGVDIGIVRAVRLWYAPSGGEFSLEIKIRDGDSKLGFSLSRTDEGFIYISEIDECDANAPAIRSGLSNLYKEATRSSKFLVVSRISNQKVLPWLVTSVGAIRCYDVVSLSHKLSLHRRAKVPILLHLFSWETTTLFTDSQVGSPSFRLDNNPPEISPPDRVRDADDRSRIHHQPSGLFPDTSDEAGEGSLRFHDINVSDEWLRQ